MIDLSVVIVSWNTRELLQQCLESILSQKDEIRIEIFVIDNASTDDSGQMVQTRFPRIRLIQNEDNPGFARGNNQGMAQAGGRYIMLLNPDTIIKRGAFEQLVDFADKHPDAGAFGPRTLNADGSLQASCYPEPTLFRELWRMFHLDSMLPVARYAMNNWKGETPQSVDVLQGSCLMVRRKIVEQVGRLDEDYFMYTEEIDWCTRIRSHGWLLYWVPGAEIVHLGGQSTQQVAGEMFLQLYRSKVQYFRKHQGAIKTAVYKSILLMAALVRIGAAPMMYLLQSGRRRENRALAFNYAQLAKSLPRL